jgi:hypothetical protein
VNVGDLPSSEHAEAFLAKPSPSGAATLAVDWAVRGLIIALGMHLFRRQTRTIYGRALAGSAAIEVFVLAYTATRRGV